MRSEVPKANLENRVFEGQIVKEGKLIDANGVDNLLCIFIRHTGQ